MTAPETPSATTIRTKVNEKVDESGSTVYDNVVNKLVDDVVVKRTEILSRALEHRDSLVNDLKKLREDIKTVDSEGKRTARYSEKQWQAREKAMKALENTDEAISKVLADGATKETWSKLANNV